ncbi:MAG: replication-associated recombination protein A [Nitrospinae bacterium]|nr:replication-associated recombination protein A [Nitrospinota bacterium]MDA1110063.1 replication-associated recombination protein A [Nitrospinota bacterium]
MMELFPEYEDTENASGSPLANRMRPSGWEGFLGQEHLVGEGRPLRRLIEKNASFSFILWGPPGSGKTTIARLTARSTKSEFHEISAVNAGVADIRKVIATAQKMLRASRRPTILFIDEIHRFNKAQQDAVLPYVEDGTVRLIGSTTENPSLEVIPSLRSRCQIFRLKYLSEGDIRAILQKALQDKEKGLGNETTHLEEDALDFIISHANGDARRALNVLEAAMDYAQGEGETAPVSREVIEGIIQEAATLYDKGGTEHYDHASAFQKSLRGSDADAAIYWLAKMIAGGEDPKFIVRRLMVTAAEDVGLADPQALVIANAAAEAVDRLGMPEARIALAQAAIYVALARKDNTAIVAIDRALGDIQGQGKSYPVPDHLKDSHYSDAKKYGYGVEYKYPHDYPGHHVEQEYLPEELRGRKYVGPEKKNKTGFNTDDAKK